MVKMTYRLLFPLGKNNTWHLPIFHFFKFFAHKYKKKNQLLLY